eukprot:1145958-Pelagomonas_calceolata.AAC.3
MDVSLLLKNLVKVTSLEVGEEAVAGAECSLFPPRPSLRLNGYLEFVIGTLFIGKTIIASGRLEVSLCLTGKRRGIIYLGRVLC